MGQATRLDGEGSRDSDVDVLAEMSDETSTFMPASAQARAVAAPIPVPPPVMRILRPSIRGPMPGFMSKSRVGSPPLDQVVKRMVNAAWNTVPAGTIRAVPSDSAAVGASIGSKHMKSASWGEYNCNQGHSASARSSIRPPVGLVIAHDHPPEGAR